MYLAVVVDLCTREVVGHATAARQNADLTINALRAAHSAGLLAGNAIAHADRGTQYTCRAYRHELIRLDLRQSLSRTGSCLDNAPAEAFFATLKTEIDIENSDTRAEATQTIETWITGFYNSERLHSSIGYLAPATARTERHNRWDLTA